MKEKIKLPKIEDAYDETITPETVEKSVTPVPQKKNGFLRLVRSFVEAKYPKARGYLKYFAGESDYETEIAEKVSGLARKYSDFAFGKKSAYWGPRVFGEHWDQKTYAEVKSDVYKYISGDPALEHVAQEYGDVVFDGKKVLAKQDGVSAHYITDPEKALGKFRYKWIQFRTGLSKEKIDEAIKKYLLSHEEAEAGHQRRNPHEIRIDDSKHGEIQAYVLKSLKELGENDAYKVGVHIDGKRIDAFGHYIKKHATPDVELDLRRAALAPA